MDKLTQLLHVPQACDSWFKDALCSSRSLFVFHVTICESVVTITSKHNKSICLNFKECVRVLRNNYLVDLVLLNMCVFQNKFKWKKENHLVFLAFLFTTYWQTKLLTHFGRKPLFVRAFDGSELFKAEHPTKIQWRRSAPVSAYELLTSVKIWCMDVNK